MKAKNLLLTLAVGAMAISCNNSGSMTQTSASLKTTADSASFYIGYMYGSGLQQMGFSEVNREALIAGLNSAIAKKEVGKDPREIQMFLNGFMQEVAMKKATENAEKGKKFLEENAKKSGVDTLANGIQYKIIKKGEGAKPAATDMVKVHYRGTLIDGTEFDSSIKRGEPVEFPLNRDCFTTNACRIEMGNLYPVGSGLRPKRKRLHRTERNPDFRSRTVRHRYTGR